MLLHGFSAGAGGKHLLFDDQMDVKNYHVAGALNPNATITWSLGYSGVKAGSLYAASS